MQKRRSTRVRAVYIWLMAPLLGVAVFLAVLASSLAPVAKAATTSTYLNFQARILGTGGGVVPDGNYNIDFKIYNADSTTGSVGTCSGACLWEETRKNSNAQGVQVINGYFSVNLGSVTSFPAINWDQQLWLTMNIGGTTTGASPTWDGEMQNAGHSIALTALPYSFAAGQLAKTDGSGNRGTLAFGTVANNPNVLLPDASGTVCLQSAGACGFELTTGTDFIRNQTTVQTANFNVQSAAISSVAAVIQGASGQTADLLDINNGTTVLSIGNNGQTLFKPTVGHDSTTFLQIQPAGSTTPVLDVDTTTSRVGIGTNAPSVKLDVAESTAATALRVSSTWTTLNATNSIQEWDNNGIQRSILTSAGIQQWFLYNGAAEAGKIAYSTPAGLPGIIFFNTSGTGRSQLRQLSTSGGLSFGAGTSSSDPNTQFSLDTNGAVLFQNSTNTNAAFAIQNTANNNFLLVNTSDGYVINNGTTDLSGNLIQNSGFESSGTTDGTGWYTPSASQVLTNSSANAHSGNYELQVTGNSSTHAITTKYFAVHPGDTIYAEAWIKNSAGANGDGGIYLEFSDKDKGNATFSNADTGLPGTSYILKTITTTVPAGKVYVRMAASVKATSSTGTFYFDDFYLKRGNEQSPLLLTNTSTTAFQVQNASSQTVLGVDTTGSKIFTTIPDGASAIGFTFNTPSYTTAGAKLLSLQNNSAEKFYVDKDGNINMSGGITAGGDISTTGNMNIGSGKVYKVNNTQISSADLSNNSDLAKLAGTGPQIFSGNNKFSGTVLIDNSNAAGFQVQNSTDSVFTVDTSGKKIILGTASSLTGKIVFQGSGGAGTLTLTGPTTPDAGNYTLSIPAITGNANICTDNSICSGYESVSAATASLATKLNKNSVDTSSAAVTALQGYMYGFTNSSSTIASGILKLDNGTNSGNALTVTGSNNYGAGNAYIVVNNTNGTPSGYMLDLQANSTSEFNVDASGNVTALGNVNIASGKEYRINGISINTNGTLTNVAYLGQNQTFSGNNTFSSASNSFTGDGAGLTNLNASNVASGTLNDGRLSSNVALLSRTAQTFNGDNTFAPTSNNAGTIIKQTSGTATSGSVLDVQTANGTSHFLQITNAAANEGAVTLQSVGATRDLTLGSASGTLILTAATNTIQHANSSLTIDINNNTDTTFTITNAQSSVVASLSVEGDIAVGASRVYKVGATSGTSTTCAGNTYSQNQVTNGGIVTSLSCANAVNSISTAGGSIANGASISGNALTLGYADTSNPGLVSTGTQTFGGAKTFKVTSTTAFQVQSASFNVMTVDTSNAHLKVYDGTATQAYVDIYYDDATSSAVITASTGTTKVGNGTGPITLNAGAASAITITGHASSSWTLDSGDLTIDVTSASTPGLNLGTGAQAKTLTFGNTTGATSVTINAGSNGITLGANTTVSNGKELILGGNGSDLTCTNGAIFYRSDTNRFRGCENGTWIYIDNYADVQTYTSGDNTWTKPTNAQAVEVVLVGAGGGGGGGGARNGGQERNGGGGGGGGTYASQIFTASDLGSTAHAAVGGAGSSGAGAASSATAGSNGGAGGTSCFSSAANCTGTLYVEAFGGGGGGGGNQSGTAGGGGGGGGGVGAAGGTGSNTSNTAGSGGGPNGGAANASSSGGAGAGGGSANSGTANAGTAGGSAEYGGGGGGGAAGGNSASGNGGSSVHGAGGGGAGASTNSGNSTGAGGAGGTSQSITSGGGGAAGTNGAACTAGNGLGANGGTGTTVKAGSGGGGGGANGGGGGTGCAGGNGGAPGGGGGGGGSGSGSAGAGGTGGAGEIWVISW